MQNKSEDQEETAGSLMILTIKGPKEGLIKAGGQETRGETLPELVLPYLL